LRAWFADGLGGDNTRRFSELHQAAGGQIASVARDAHAMLTLAGQHRTNFYLFHAGSFDGARSDLVDFLASLGQSIFRVARIINVVAREAADDSFAQLDDFIFAFINGLDPNAVTGAAIVFA